MYLQFVAGCCCCCTFNVSPWTSGHSWMLYLSFCLQLLACCCCTFNVSPWMSGHKHLFLYFYDDIHMTKIRHRQTLNVVMMYLQFVAGCCCCIFNVSPWMSHMDVAFVFLSFLSLFVGLLLLHIQCISMDVRSQTLIAYSFPILSITSCCSFRYLYNLVLECSNICKHWMLNLDALVLIVPFVL